MRTLKGMGRALIAASLSVAAGVAVNQILNNGELSWNWGYLALVFTVLGVLTQTPEPPAPTGEETATPHCRTARRPWRARHAYLRRVRSSVDQMETQTLVSAALGYAAPLRDGRRPVPQRDMVLAAVSILAAMTLCEEQESGQLRVILGGALCTLITLTPDTGPRPGAASLVLVRN